jgi:hypothetical protein
MKLAAVTQFGSRWPNGKEDIRGGQTAGVKPTSTRPALGTALAILVLVVRQRAAHVRFMRPLILLTLLTLLPSLQAAELKFVRVWPEWRTADSFIRLSEYFNGRENTGGQTILRSQSAERSGYYFLIRTKSDSVVTGAKIELQVLLPGVEKAQTFTFSAEVPAGQHVTLAGLTGRDWPGETVRPTAWHLTMRAADGTVLATEQSFLWALPITTTSTKPPSATP